MLFCLWLYGLEWMLFVFCGCVWGCCGGVLYCVGVVGVVKVFVGFEYDWGWVVWIVCVVVYGVGLVVVC